MNHCIFQKERDKQPLLKLGIIYQRPLTDQDIRQASPDDYPAIKKRLHQQPHNNEIYWVFYTTFKKDIASEYKNKSKNNRGEDCGYSMGIGAFKGGANPDFFEDPCHQIQPNTSASNALGAFFKGPTDCDCGSYVVAKMYQLVKDIVGEKEFDARFGGIDTPPSEGLLSITSTLTKSNPIIRYFSKTSEDDKNGIYFAYYKNPYYDQNKEKFKWNDPWAGLNAMLIYDCDQWRLFGLGAQNITQKQVHKKFKDHARHHSLNDDTRREEKIDKITLKTLDRAPKGWKPLQTSCHQISYEQIKQLAEKCEAINSPKMTEYTAVQDRKKSNSVEPTTGNTYPKNKNAPQCKTLTIFLCPAITATCSNSLALLFSK